jgi:hypothetical protein
MHDDSVLCLDRDAVVSNRLDKVDHRSDLCRVDRARVRNQERPYGAPELDEGEEHREPIVRVRGGINQATRL